MAVKARRYQQNPILAPNEQNHWEAQAAFNGSVVKKNGHYYKVYRAISNPQRYFGLDLELSSIGSAVSQNGLDFEKRRQLIPPEYEWEQFGCEDPRVTQVDDKYLIFYTAIADYPHTAEGIKVGVAITKDFIEVEEKHQVTHFNSKAAALFPERVDGRLAVILTVGTDKPPAKIALAFFDKLEQVWSEDYWNEWLTKLDQHTISLHRDEHDHVEIGAAPVKTKDGWVLIYSHIKNYFSPPPVFGIEAVLLNLKDPTKVIGRTKQPLLIPQEEYEIYGKVPNVVFPSGALIEDKILNIYYGAADTVSCLAQLEVDDLLREISPTRKKPVYFSKKVILERSPENPIIQPKPENDWESKFTFNPAALYENDKVHLVYRAQGPDQTSVLGHAASNDGVNFNERSSEPIYVPREPFEKKTTLGASGCEDPRITKLGNRLYMCYTAFDGHDPWHIAFTSIKTEDFLRKKWQWSTPKIISCPHRSDKNACLVSEKIRDKYVFFHRIGGCIWVDYQDKLTFNRDEWLGGKILICPNVKSWDSEKVGIAGPPHKTKEGWLLIYHGLSSQDKKYRLGAMLLDSEYPERIISKLEYPILEPEEEYETKGFRPDTVFSCGSVIVKNRLYVYYGAADQVICVASVELDKLLRAFFRTA